MPVGSAGGASAFGGRDSTLGSSAEAAPAARRELDFDARYSSSSAWLASAASDGGAPLLVVRAARVLDVEKGAHHAPGEVVVRGDRIVSVGPAGDTTVSARVVDLGDRTLLPG